MKWTFSNELARKFVHLLSLFILLIYFVVSDFFNRNIALFILVSLLVVFLELEYLRIEVAGKIPLLNKVWKYVRRKKEKDRLGGDVFFLIGAIMVLSIFNIQVAVAAILMTTFGDMAAALIGKRFGKHQLFGFKERTVEGTSSELVVDLVIAIIVFSYGNLTLLYSWPIWAVILAMSLTATFVEVIVYKLDDNLLIPIVSGFVGQVFYYLLRPF